MTKYITKKRVCKNCDKHYNVYATRKKHKNWSGYCADCCRSSNVLGHLHDKMPSFSTVKSNSSGYVKIKIPAHPHANSFGWVLEHRWVMEKRMRKFLRPSDVVHHINEKRDDNRVENLRVYPDDSTHFIVHAKNLYFDDDKFWLDFLEEIFGVNT